MNVAIICTALLGLLLFGLGFMVSSGRSNQLFHFNPDPTDPLYKKVRAHGNTAEYAPFLGVLFLATGSLDPATWVLWCIGIATLSRYLIVIGLMVGDMSKPHPLRFVGALGTYLAGIVLSGNLIYQVI